MTNKINHAFGDPCPICGGLMIKQPLASKNRGVDVQWCLPCDKLGVFDPIKGKTKMEERTNG